ncbi:MAG: tRNA (adenosine(37)-N6)-threonylcarbamoyltransferase complex dimerization subunit type 1 TsaB [Bacteroidetes bacterium]|nr:tRNA (adenosine(37)-N6)-threonylcarbamoyltransferase complex dimerization subunit type 1 TsaB [Bacteroidota bacterium]MDA0904133.1 tRNA (adenosine(37)-N6)-threonylcarbamoyltransferase complex dimerization subunit type 1 TsaB [Bacteroidota bacterium]MDA1242657.1 tRNA (adenosine(37)-N6)-threonylcarbamoyltransferase complex dimerization subunit type 1 TsaB [Bacteroidota bacterium]
MARILILDTATLQCSVALAEDGVVVAFREEREEGYVHAERLLPLIDDVMTEHGWTPRDLEAVAVSGGPGSFTGLRIGVSTAKGICHAQGIPLIALDTLQLLAIQGERLDPHATRRVAMVDARRMEVYAATFDAQHRCVGEVAPVVVEDGQDPWQGPAQFIGDGALKCAELCAGEGRTFVEAWPLARDGAAPAEAAFAAGEFVHLPSYEPNYVKAFKAGAPKDPLGLRTRVFSAWVWLLMFATMIGCSSCGETQQFIPYVPVNIDIDLNLPAYSTLNFPGEAIALNGGSRGLYVYRYTLDEFVVLDRHATFDIDLGCQVTLDNDNITLNDDSDCSASQWLMLDGSVMNGPATLPLHRYRTSLNGSILHIYN